MLTNERVLHVLFSHLWVTTEILISSAQGIPGARIEGDTLGFTLAGYLKLGSTILAVLPTVRSTFGAGVV
jgi:hypothetical protein